MTAVTDDAGMVVERYGNTPYGSPLDPGSPDELVDVMKQIIPARYNQQSELEVEFPVDGETCRRGRKTCSARIERPRRSIGASHP